MENNIFTAFTVAGACLFIIIALFTGVSSDYKKEKEKIMDDESMSLEDSVYAIEKLEDWKKEMHSMIIKIAIGMAVFVAVVVACTGVIG